MATTGVDGKGSKAALTDNSKTRVDLIAPQFIEGIGEILRYGAAKYAEHNWKRGIKFSAIIGGVLRHVLAFARGENHDPETGKSHLLHAACGLMFLFWYTESSDVALYLKEDDRVFSPRCKLCGNPPTSSRIDLDYNKATVYTCNRCHFLWCAPL